MDVFIQYWIDWRSIKNECRNQHIHQQEILKYSRSATTFRKTRFMCSRSAISMSIFGEYMYQTFVWAAWFYRFFEAGRGPNYFRKWDEGPYIATTIVDCAWLRARVLATPTLVVSAMLLICLLQLTKLLLRRRRKQRVNLFHKSTLKWDASLGASL